MKNWRYWHTLVLLSVFAYRILIHGTLLSIATHNIPADQLSAKEINWSQLIFKMRKRNTDGAPAAHEASTANIASGREISKKIPALPFTTFFGNQFAALRSRYFIPLALTPPFDPDKFFLKFCCLRR